MSRRAEYGSGSSARPDAKMGRQRRDMQFGDVIVHYSTPVTKTIKRVAARKRRQRDRSVPREL